MRTYPVRLSRDRRDGGYVVTCRDLPEAITQGGSIEEALSEAEGALQAAIEGRIEDGPDIPAPALPKHGERNVATPVTTALKAAVYIAMREQVVSKRDRAGVASLRSRSTTHGRLVNSCYETACLAMLHYGRGRKKPARS